MKKSLIFISISAIIIISMLAYYFYSQSSSTTNNQIQQAPAQQAEQETQIQETQTPVSTKPILAHFGLAIEPLNAQTNKAGDIIFTKDLLYDDGRVSNDKAFVDFGHKDKYFQNEIGNIEYWFHVPLKTEIKSPVSGIASIGYIEHTKDYLINIDIPNSEYTVSFEHLVDLVVTEGQAINTNDVLGHASPRNTFNNKLAMVELAIWTSDQHIIKYCPFDFLQEDLKPLYTTKLNTLASDWETYINKDVYQQQAWVSPGCLVSEIQET